MANRLTKIFTKKGDDGTTDLGGNQRVPKYDQQIEVYGCLDELSAAIGILVAEGDLSENIQAFLINAQQDLFNIQSITAIERICCSWSQSSILSNSSS